MTIPEHCLAQIKELRNIIRYSPALIAGGWVRDIFTGDAPSDIDVFLTMDKFEKSLEFFNENNLTYETLTSSNYDDPTQVIQLEWGLTGGKTCSECKGTGEQVLFTSIAVCNQCNGKKYENTCPIQLIGVENIYDHIQERFDAHCNMLGINLHEPDAGVLEFSSKAIPHAANRTWEVNPDTKLSMAKLQKRAEQFKARGYTVRI